MQSNDEIWSVLKYNKKHFNEKSYTKCARNSIPRLIEKI